MASLQTIDGRRIIQFTYKRQRRTIRLGRASLGHAEQVQKGIEDLLSAKKTNSTPHPATTVWVRGLDDELYDKLAAYGLVEERERATLGAFLAKYMSGRSDVKRRTQMKYESTRKLLVEFFGEDAVIRDIKVGHAKEFKAWLCDGRAVNTVRKHIAIAKQFLAAAADYGLVDKNPFSGIPSTIQANEARLYNVTRDEASRVLDACPSLEWKLIFALARFGGLRCPSEHLELTWDDIDWEHGRMTVRSPKTEHHVGHAERTVPLFPEIRELLSQAYHEADEGTVYVITKTRCGETNWRTHMRRIIRKAGIEPWEKTFQNLRSSCQTELAEYFPGHVVNKWLGNSEKVANKHYLQTTEQHFQRAANGIDSPKSSALHFPMHSPVLSGPQSSVTESGDPLETSTEDEGGPLVIVQVAEEGLEPPTRGL